MGEAELVRSLGAARVIDYAREDFAASSDSYDVILDAWTSSRSRDAGVALAQGGILLATDGMQNFLLVLATRWTSDKQVRFLSMRRYEKKDVVFLGDLIGAGSYRAVVDRIYPWADVVDATG